MKEIRPIVHIDLQSWNFGTFSSYQKKPIKFQKHISDELEVNEQLELEVIEQLGQGCYFWKTYSFLMWDTIS